MQRRRFISGTAALGIASAGTPLPHAQHKVISRLYAEHLPRPYDQSLSGAHRPSWACNDTRFTARDPQGTSPPRCRYGKRIEQLDIFVPPTARQPPVFVYCQAAPGCSMRGSTDRFPAPAVLPRMAARVVPDSAT